MRRGGVRRVSCRDPVQIREQQIPETHGYDIPQSSMLAYQSYDGNVNSISHQNNQQNRLSMAPQSPNTLNRSLSTPAMNHQVSNGGLAPKIFIANLDYAMKVAEYVPVLRKQLEKHGIEIIDGECFQDKADATGRNRYAILTVASEEQVRLAKSKSNEVKVGYRKVWIYDDTELTTDQRDDILRQLRDQLAKQQSVKVNSGPKPLPPYQHQNMTNQPNQQMTLLHHQTSVIETPPEDGNQRRRYSSCAPYMRQSTTINGSSGYMSQNQANSNSAFSAIPTVEITPEDDYDISNISTPPSLFQMITPQTSDTSAYMSGTSPTPPDNSSNSKHVLNSSYSTTPSFGARAIVGRRRASAFVPMETPERLVPVKSHEAEDEVQIELGGTSLPVYGDSVGINLIKTHGEMFLDYVLCGNPIVTKQTAINRFRQLINDVCENKPLTPSNNSFLYDVMSIINDLRKLGLDRICFNKQQPGDIPVQLSDWNKSLSVQVNGAPLELYLRMHPCVTIMRLKACHSAAASCAPLWHMTLTLDCEKWAYASNFWLETSWPLDFFTVFHKFVEEIEQPTLNNSSVSSSRSVCLERSYFDGVVEDLEELERQGWLHLLGSEFDDGSPRLVGLTLPGYAGLWRRTVNRRIHSFESQSFNCLNLLANSDIDGRQWLCIADLLRMSEDDEAIGLRPFGLFAFIDGFVFQPQWVLSEHFSFRVAPPSTEQQNTPDVSITCNSQRCAKERRLAIINELIQSVPPGTSMEESVAFDLDRLNSDAFTGCRRFSALNKREDLIPKLPYSFQISSISPKTVNIARPEKSDKSGLHLRRLSWLAMCLHAAGTMFFSLDELSLLYSRLFPAPGAGPLVMLESLIELHQGPMPILACDTTSAVGLTPLGLVASSIRQVLLANDSVCSPGCVGKISSVKRLVDEYGASIEDVLEVLTTQDPNTGPHWLQMITPTNECGKAIAIQHGSKPDYVKLRSVFQQSVNPNVMASVIGHRASFSSMLNIALASQVGTMTLSIDNQDDDENDEGDDDFEQINAVCPSTLSPASALKYQRRMSAPATSFANIAGHSLSTPPLSPAVKPSLLISLGGRLLNDDDDNDDDESITMSGHDGEVANSIGELEADISSTSYSYEDNADFSFYCPTQF